MKLLLTGASGNLGKELVKIAPDFGIQYICTASKDFDITDLRSIKIYREYNHINFEGVVHCAAYTDVTKAETSRIKAVEANIIGTKNIVSEFCKPNGVSLVYISTDYVYDCKKGFFSETDIPRPINFYAMTKLAGEAYAKPEDLIIRTSFKPSVWKHPYAFWDLYTSADYVDVIARKISFLVSQKAQGIYNVGTGRKSVYELAKRRNPKVLPISKNTIQDVNMPDDCTMNIMKYTSFCESKIPSGGI